MEKFIKIEFYPDFMDKIISFHFVNKETLDLLKQIKNNDNYFIEKFYRVSKNTFKSLSNKNLEIIELLIDDPKFILAKNYLEIFGNCTDLLDLIMSNFDLSSSEELDISDEDFTDSINIGKILGHKLNKENDKINEIFEKNPHLKNDSELTDLLNSE